MLARLHSHSPRAPHSQARGRIPPRGSRAPRRGRQPSSRPRGGVCDAALEGHAGTEPLEGTREHVANTSRRRVLGAGVVVGLAAIGNTAVAGADDDGMMVPLELSRVDAELSPSVSKLNVVTSDLSDDDFNYLEAVPTENVVATEANVAFAPPSLSMAMNTFGTPLAGSPSPLAPASLPPRHPNLRRDDAESISCAVVDMPDPRAPRRDMLCPPSCHTRPAASRVRGAGHPAPPHLHTLTPPREGWL